MSSKYLLLALSISFLLFVSGKKEYTCDYTNDTATAQHSSKRWKLVRYLKQKSCVRRMTVQIITVRFACGGILRYDGKSYTNFTQDGLEDDVIWSMLEDRAGNIWIGTNHARLVSFRWQNLYRFFGESV